MQTGGRLWGIALAAAIAGILWFQPGTALAAGVVLTTTDPKITTDDKDKNKHTTKLTLYNITDSSADVAAAVDGAQRGGCTISPDPSVIAANQATEVTLTFAGSCQVEQGVPTKLTITSNDASRTETTIRTTMAKPDAKTSIAPRLRATAMAAGISTGILLLALAFGHWCLRKKHSGQMVDRVAGTDPAGTISLLRKILWKAIRAQGQDAVGNAKKEALQVARAAVEESKRDEAAAAMNDFAPSGASKEQVEAALLKVKVLIDPTAVEREEAAKTALESVSWNRLLTGLGTEWSIKDSWIANTTIGATALIALFAAGDVLTTVFGREQKDAIAFMAVSSAIATVLVSLAPLAPRVISGVTSG